jgi:signal peptidase complex subunit 1
MDYKGQALAEYLFKLIMWIFAIVGFAVGYLIYESFYVTFFIALLGAIVAAFVTVPEWDFLNQNPIIFTNKGD